jgi:hypothetical protein
LSNQASLVPHNNPIGILFVLEHPLGSDDVAAILELLHQRPNFVALEVVEFFLHSFYPIRVFKCLKHLLRFHTRDEGMMDTKVG